jgi:hypothetical protein
VGREPGKASPGKCQPESFVAGEGGEPDQDAQAQQARIADPGAARLAQETGDHEAGAEDQGREGTRGIGQGAEQDERQLDGRGQPGSQGQRAGPPGRQPELRGDVGTQAPGQDRDERANQERRDLGDSKGRAEQEHRQGDEERRQGQPDLECRPREGERRRLEAPQGIARQAVAGDQVARHHHVVGSVLRRREGHGSGKGDPDQQGEDEDQGRRATCLTAGRCPAHEPVHDAALAEARTTQRGSPVVMHTG